jgi:23S rRNA (uracil1939-C5)-methyltransferase
LTVEDEVIASFEPPIVRFGGIAVAVPPGVFLQASAEGEAALSAFVTEHAKGAKRIADLFSGCGTFSLPLAGAAAVDAFDTDGPVIAALDGAGRAAAGLRHPLKAKQRNLFERPLSADELKTYDAVVFDPPRAGARAQAMQLAQSAVPLVIGISCNPASFARDAAILRDGGYHLSQVLPVDQFVYSPHVELAGVFMKG